MSNIVIQNENNSGASIFIKYPSLRYLNEFISLRCAPEFLIRDIFPNAKEITESMACFNAIRKYIKVKNFNNKNFNLFDVACGSTPRTASLFAFLTQWICTAIDPKLKNEIYNIKKLKTYKYRIEDCEFKTESTTIIIACHSHVKLDIINKQIKAPRKIFVSIECCKPLFLTGHKPVKVYEDYGIHSPKREIKIWDIKE